MGYLDNLRAKQASAAQPSAAPTAAAPAANPGLPARTDVASQLQARNQVQSPSAVAGNLAARILSARVSNKLPHITDGLYVFIVDLLSVWNASGMGYVGFSFKVEEAQESNNLHPQTGKPIPSNRVGTTCGGSGKLDAAAMVLSTYKALLCALLGIEEADLTQELVDFSYSEANPFKGWRVMCDAYTTPQKFDKTKVFTHTRFSSIQPTDDQLRKFQADLELFIKTSRPQ